MTSKGLESDRNQLGPGHKQEDLHPSYDLVVKSWVHLLLALIGLTGVSLCFQGDNLPRDRRDEGEG